MSGKRSKKGVRKKLSPDARRQRLVQRSHSKLIRNALRLAGFQSVASVSDKEFVYEGAKSDFDDVYIYENIVIFAEYTIRQESDVSSHLKVKKILYDKIAEDPPAFLDFFSKQFPNFSTTLGNKYLPHHFRVKILYCSFNTVKSSSKELIPNVVYYDYHIARYFDVVSKTVKRSARFEYFALLGLEYKDVAQGVLMPNNVGSLPYAGSILPETHSNFGRDFKVVSFYVDPAALLQRSYVLRKFGWRLGNTVYQRMISQVKIAAVRKYLHEQKRVFINNIIVTLPDDTKLLDKDGNTVNPKDILETQPGVIQIPSRFNSITNFNQLSSFN